MPRIRFSLKWLFGLVAFVSIACVALVRANDWTASVMLSTAVALLFISLVGATLRQGPARAFWLGFAICGWGYFWATHWPSKTYSRNLRSETPWTMENDDIGNLATTKVLAFVYQDLLPFVRESPQQNSAAALGYGGVGYGGLAGGYGYGPSTGGVAGTATGSSATLQGTMAIRTRSYPAQHEFTIVGHSLFTITFAFIGGWLGRAFYAANRQIGIPQEK